MNVEFTTLYSKASKSVKQKSINERDLFHSSKLPLYPPPNTDALKHIYQNHNLYKRERERKAITIPSKLKKNISLMLIIISFYT